MRWHSYRPRVLTTQLGETHVERAYWHCPACGQGAAPADAAWELPSGQASWGVRACASLLGVLLPFRQAAEVLARLTPMQVSPRALEAGVKKIEDAFRSGNPEAVLTLVTPVKRDTYKPIFEAHRRDLPRVANLLATRKFVATNGAQAEFTVTDAARTFTVYFLRCDGVWCLLEL
ncbi:MAG: hypothetical protein ACYDCO_04340 [Armatimonadota bacterium]